jgi:hypothetical protein
MLRVIAVVEGQTEQALIQRVLAPHLGPLGISMSARILGEPGHKGGNVKMGRVVKDVVVLMRQEPQAVVTTLIDRYELGAGWPLVDESPSQPELSLKMLSEALDAEVAANLGRSHPYHFIPYCGYILVSAVRLTNRGSRTRTHI